MSQRTIAMESSLESWRARSKEKYSVDPAGFGIHVGMSAPFCDEIKKALIYKDFVQIDGAR
jgi:hypothetical protein